MSRQTVILCDMCGEEVLSWRIREESAQIKLWAPGEHRSYGGRELIYAPAVMESLLTFWIEEQR